MQQPRRQPLFPWLKQVSPMIQGQQGRNKPRPAQKMPFFTPLEAPDQQARTAATYRLGSVRGWPGALGRIGGCLLILVIAGVPAWVATGQLPAGSPSGRLGTERSVAIDVALDQSTSHQQLRSREGSLLQDQLGTFKLRGDRIAFVPADSQQSYCVLENLMLERVWRVLSESHGRKWRVSGIITEYRGANYLLLTRAVVLAE